jgi:hypothetical protein
VVASGVEDRVWVPIRVDRWLVVAVVLVLSLLVAAVVPLMLAPDVAERTKWLVGAMALATVALTFGVTVPLRYAFEHDGIFIRAGIMRMRLAYPDIVLAEKVVSPLSSAAWSMVKVRMVLGQGGLLEIAPRDREAFLEELGRRAPHLRPTERGLADPRRVKKAA